MSINSNLHRVIDEDVWTKINEKLIAECRDRLWAICADYSPVVHRDVDVGDLIYSFFPRPIRREQEGGLGDDYIHKVLGGCSNTVGMESEVTNDELLLVHKMFLSTASVVGEALDDVDEIYARGLGQVRFFPLMRQTPALLYNMFQAMNAAMVSVVDVRIQNEFRVHDIIMDYQVIQKEQVGKFIRYLGFRRYEIIERFATIESGLVSVIEVGMQVQLAHSRRRFTSTEESVDAAVQVVTQAQVVYGMDHGFTWDQFEEMHRQVEW
jgi:hypothetical protein